MNAKIGVAALVAALFVAFGAFALQGSDTAKAGALPPLLVYTCTNTTAFASNDGCNLTTPLAAGASVASGTVVRIVANFGNNQAAASVVVTGTASASTIQLVPYPAYKAPYPGTLYTTGLPNANQDVTPLVQDDNAVAGNAFDLTAATMNAIGTNQDDNLTLELRTVITCTAAGTVTITQNQALVFADGVATLAFSFNCTPPTPTGDVSTTTLSVRKIDQFASCAARPSPSSRKSSLVSGSPSRPWRSAALLLPTPASRRLPAPPTRPASRRASCLRVRAALVLF